MTKASCLSLGLLSAIVAVAPPAPAQDAPGPMTPEFFSGADGPPQTPPAPSPPALPDSSADAGRERAMPEPPMVPNAVGVPYTLGAPERDPNLRLFTTFEAGIDWFRRLPSLSFASDPEQLPGRDVAARPLRRTANAFLGKLGVDLGLRIGDRWTVPVMGLSVGLGLLGSNPRLVTSSDGSMVGVHPRATQVTLLLPGLGRAWIRRRWAFSTSVRALAMYTAMPATVATGGGATEVTVDAWSLGLRADLEACHRLDPTTRLCLVVAPHLYESGFVNGGSLGLRWEMGR